jgi:mono/diheme cytochrome c family protein
MSFARTTTGLAMALLAGALGCGGEPAETELPGRIAFERHCAACHGMEGKGDGPVAANLHTRPADLTRLAERRGGTWDEAWVVSSIDGRRAVAAHGPRDMPVWGTVFEDELAAEEQPYPRYTTFLRVRSLADYLKTIQR